MARSHGRGRRFETCCAHKGLRDRASSAGKGASALQVKTSTFRACQSGKGREASPRLAAAENEYLYRYMSLAKFIDLLETGSLFFCRTSALPDKAEGLTLTERERLMFVALRDIAGRDKSVIERERERHKMEALQQEYVKEFTFVSCWHSGNAESFAMWKLYIDGFEGVCVRTTRDRLAEVADQAKQVWSDGDIAFADVVYGRPLPKELGEIALFFQKRREYAYEQETRIVVSFLRSYGKKSAAWDTDRGQLIISSGGGMSLPVDTARLVERVIVHPQAPDWFRELIHRLLERTGLKNNVLKVSDLIGTLA
jgi:hypothetical protein